jgi:hypothetical protein
MMEECDSIHVAQDKENWQLRAMTESRVSFVFYLTMLLESEAVEYRMVG